MITASQIDSLTRHQRHAAEALPPDLFAAIGEIARVVAIYTSCPGTWSSQYAAGCRESARSGALEAMGEAALSGTDLPGLIAVAESCVADEHPSDRTAVARQVRDLVAGRAAR